MLMMRINLVTTELPVETEALTERINEKIYLARKTTVITFIID